MSIQEKNHHRNYKKDRKYRRNILLFLTFLWMVIIFAHSAKTADESTEASHRVGMLIGQMVVPGFAEWSFAKQMEFAARIDHPVRKTAHATEYAILGVLVLLTGIAWDEESQKKDAKESFRKSHDHKNDLKKENLQTTRKCFDWKYSWMLATIYACTDEFHQLFVPGRSGQITDVCIDSLGAFTGGILVWFLLRWISRRSKLAVE